MENFIVDYDEEKLKKIMMSLLVQHNKVLDEKNLCELLDYIKNSTIKLGEKYAFFKDYESDVYKLNTTISFYQTGTKEIISPSLRSKFKNGKGYDCYDIIYLSGKNKMYIFSFDNLFSFLSEGLCYYHHFTIFTFDELVQFVKEHGGYCCHIYEKNENGKYEQKSICIENGISVYRIDFGEYGVYIGQSKDVKKRMGAHKSQAKKGNHCYVLNELFNKDENFFMNALKNVQIIEMPIYTEYKGGRYTVADFEYDLQINALRNGEKLLGRQCWDTDFRDYLAHNVDEYEYQELLEKSYQINKDPNNPNGYSTYNPCAKRLYNKQMNYEDVVRYFETLRKERESSTDGSFIM